MVIRTDYYKLKELSARLRRIENDIADISGKITKLSATGAEFARHRSTEYYVKRACDNAIASARKVTASTREACWQLDKLSSLANDAAASYRENDKIRRINSAVSRVGPNLGNIFNCGDYWAHVSFIGFDIRRFL